MTLDWEEPGDPGTEPVPATPPSPPPPPASATAAAPAPLTPAQQTELRSRIDAIRADKMSPVNHGPGHPRYAEAHAELEGLYRRLYPEGAEDAPPAPDPGPGEGSAGPTTAAEALQAWSPPALSEAAQQQGLAWDAKQREEVYGVAEAEGLLPFVRRAELLVAELAGQELPTGQETEDWLFATRGEARVMGENERFTDAWEWIKEKLPSTAAALTRSGVFYHPRTWDLLLELYEQRYDATTAHGHRRLRERWAAKQAAGARA
jgi:hypothetical protein